MINRDRMYKNIFKTVCEQKKEFEFTDGPQIESSFEDSLNKSLNDDSCSDTDVQTTIKKEFISSMLNIQLILLFIAKISHNY